MNTPRKTVGVALAMAAGGMLAGCAGDGGQAYMASAEKTVHCYGVNKCKGYNDCKTASNACKGMASCKGQGFVKMSEHACNEVGGTIGS
ncbi:MAG: hypothetical protein D6720_13715 [Gammaproteobacteria bacterium]|nr:MAG: hypothetical protein D6720_13715 [Gammaproteobacteria bacterium]